MSRREPHAVWRDRGVYKRLHDLVGPARPTIKPPNYVQQLTISAAVIVATAINAPLHAQDGRSRATGTASQNHGPSADTSVLRSDLLDYVWPPTMYLNSNGTSVAIVRFRPLRETLLRRGNDWTNELWIASAPAYTPQRVDEESGTTGVTDISWSSNGRRLAYLRRRGRATQLEIWSRGAKRRFESTCFPSPDGRTDGPALAWADSARVVVLEGTVGCTPSDSLPFAGSFPDIPAAINGWHDRAFAAHASVSVANSIVDTVPPMTDASLEIVDVGRRTTTTLARGAFSEISVAPNGRYVALVERVAWRMPSGDSILPEIGSYAATVLRIIDLRSGRRIATIEPRLPILRSTLSWSPDGGHIAIVTHEWRGKNSESCAVVYVVDRPSSPFSELCGELGDRHWEMDVRRTGRTADFETPASRALTWVSGHHLLVRMYEKDSTGFDRHAAYLITSGYPLRLAARFDSALGTARNIGGQTFVVLATRLGRLVVDAGGTSVDLQEFAPSLHEPIESIDYGAVIQRRIRFRIHTDVQPTATSAGMQLEFLDHDHSTIDRYVVPIGQSVVADVGGSGSPIWITAVQVGDSSVYRLWSNRGLLAHRLLSVPHRHTRVWVHQQLIRLSGPSNDTTEAVLTLPPHSNSDQLYPMIVSVYPLYGRFVTWNRPEDSVEASGADSPISAICLARHGYAVLTVTAHFSDTGGVSGTLATEIAQSVLPAVEEVVRRGIADSTRLGLIGHSAGGYSVYSLLTQTARFRAAVALAGQADLPGMYGAFHPAIAHTDDGPYNQIWSAFFESGQLAMGAPPWRRPEAYIRNSPLFSADRISTPLLIIQGDEDFVPLGQGEQMFSALARLGKEVRLVRYWGEGHVINGYFNVIDEEERIASWFGSHLRQQPDRPAVPRNGKSD